MHGSTPATMTIQVKLLAGMILVAMMLFSASGQAWPDIDTCTSYYYLRRLMLHRFSYVGTNAAQTLLDSGHPVTRSRMNEAFFIICREMGIAANVIRSEYENCSNTEEIAANFRVFSGLCWENGAMTDFLDELLDGFESVNYESGSTCSEQIQPVMNNCRQGQIDRLLGMQDGPIAFKRKIIEQESCIAEGFGRDNVAACDNLRSLKILILTFSLYYPIAPGVTFQLSDFDL